MKPSSKRLIVLCLGIGLFVGFFLITDDDIFNIQLHNLFMLSVIVFFSVINFVDYVKQKRKEELESR